MDLDRRSPGQYARSRAIRCKSTVPLRPARMVQGWMNPGCSCGTFRPALAMSPKTSSPGLYHQLSLRRGAVWIVSRGGAGYDAG
jgi:hypothetical protein